MEPGVCGAGPTGLAGVPRGSAATAWAGIPSVLDQGWEGQREGLNMTTSHHACLRDVAPGFHAHAFFAALPAGLPSPHDTTAQQGTRGAIDGPDSLDVLDVQHITR